MSEKSTKTVRGGFSMQHGVVDAKLDAVFADAEMWSESDVEWGVSSRLLEWRTFVRHPKYPQCTMMIRLTIVPPDEEGGLSGTYMQRVITDDGTTPVSAISQIARYSVFVEEMARRGGGPIPAPDEFKIKTVKGWHRVQGDVPQARYCATVGISERTLRNWEKELEAQGKL